MADNKKYYYLKLKENFFESDEAVILESMPDGYIYSNILLKLYLRSLKNNGLLMFNNLIPYNAQMLSTITRHQVGTIEKAIQIFKQLELIEILDNGAIYMTNIQNFVGKSSTDADRKRLSRSSGQMSTISAEKSPPEIEIEKELDIELEIEKELEEENRERMAQTSSTANRHLLKLYKDFESNFGRLLSPIELDDIKDMYQNFSADLVFEALKIAISNGKPITRYIAKILHNWKLDGVTTVEQVRIREEERDKKYSKGVQATSLSQTNVPDWSTEPVKTEQTEEGQNKLAEIFAELESMEKKHE